MTEKVKKRCVELMYSWYRGLPHEGKVGEAYKMLKSQGIVKEDPTYMDKELYESLEKQRPKLFRLASETEEHETDAINDILKVNDSVTRAMSMYMQRVQGVADENGVADSGPKDSSLLDLGFDSSPAHQPQSKAEPASGATALLQSEFQNLVPTFEMLSLCRCLSGVMLDTSKTDQNRL
nr:hypothetical protein BaRGS_032688 [Batillaria attramentaria]